MLRSPFILLIFILHFALCTLHLSSFADHGLSTKPYSHELKFSHLTTEDGLSQSVVNCIYQDARGFMWFGTQDGLNKYDGYNFTVFKHDPNDSNSISNNFIYSLYVDSEEILWIGTNGGGLNSYDQRTNTFRHFKNDPDNSNSLSDNRVRQIIEDSMQSVKEGVKGKKEKNIVAKIFQNFTDTLKRVGTVKREDLLMEELQASKDVA